MAHYFPELLGYLASALIAMSMMMSSVLWLRVINMTGAVAFTIYGLLIHAYPVAALNGLIVVVNGSYLLRMLTTKEYFQLLKLDPQSDYLNYFLGFYRADIKTMLPDFEYHPVENQVTLFILRDCKPVGAFIAVQTSAGVLRVVLDYVIPGYRDLKVGRYLFLERAEFFRERGIREIVATARTKAFRAYLLRVGFAPAQDEGAFRFTFETASTD
jgi:GNAT superfamily N-acetyltransferase